MIDIVPAHNGTYARGVTSIPLTEDCWSHDKSKSAQRTPRRRWPVLPQNQHQRGFSVYSGCVDHPPDLSPPDHGDEYLDQLEGSLPGEHQLDPVPTHTGLTPRPHISDPGIEVVHVLAG